MTQIQNTAALFNSLDFLRAKSFAADQSTADSSRSGAGRDDLRGAFLRDIASPDKGLFESRLGPADAKRFFSNGVALNRSSADNDRKDAGDQRVAAEKNTIAQSLGSAALAKSERITAAFSRDESVNLKLVTAEGDTVTIVFRESQAAEFDSQQLGGRGVSFGSDQFSLARRESIGFSVVGDLNEQETDAIAALFLQLDDVLAEFFDGDYSSAVALASSLELGDGTVSALSLNANLTTSTAISRYQSIAGLGEGVGQGRGQGIASQQPRAEGAQKQFFARIEDVLAQLAQRAEELLARFSEQSTITPATPETLLNDLFAILLQVDGAPKADALSADAVQDNPQKAEVAVIEPDDIVDDDAIGDDNLALASD